jgi:hypothetical protein
MAGKIFFRSLKKSAHFIPSRLPSEEGLDRVRVLAARTIGRKVGWHRQLRDLFQRVSGTAGCGTLAAGICGRGPIDDLTEERPCRLRSHKLRNRESERDQLTVDTCTAVGLSQLSSRTCAQNHPRRIVQPQNPSQRLKTYPTPTRLFPMFIITARGMPGARWTTPNE